MLLTNAEQCRELFGGAGFIPDIRKLPTPYCPAACPAACLCTHLPSRQAALEPGLMGALLQLATLPSKSISRNSSAQLGGGRC